MAITCLIPKIILGGYWLMFAPALLLPLGTVLLSSQARRGVVGYLMLLLAVAFAALGVSFLFTLALRDAVTALAGVLAIWCVAAAITLVARRAKQRRSQSQELRTAKSSITSQRVCQNSD
jgi:cytochrome c biogenesis factor